MFEDDEPLSDTIRGAQRSHRKPDVSQGILARVEEIRKIKESEARGYVKMPSANSVPQGQPRSYEYALPLSPHRAAKLGLTSLLPSIKVKREAKFRRFLMELSDPDLRTSHPTYTALAQHFEVSVQTIKTWLLSEEAAKSLKASIQNEALQAMPSVMRSVRLRAEITGDPHAAEFIRKMAKLGTAETDAQSSFEKTLRHIAGERARAGQEQARLLQANAQAPILRVVDIEPDDYEQLPVSKEYKPPTE